MNENEAAEETKILRNESDYLRQTDQLDEAVRNLFGLPYLFPYQRLVITNILEAAEAVKQNQRIDNNNEEITDRETSGKQIVILPTGAGKSLCFQLPAMLIDGITLVIYPILSLMADQQRRLTELGFSPALIRGEQSREERDEIWDKLEKGQSKIIIANPEILLTEQIRKRMEKININHVVIDEAHCVSEWGETFRPSYLKISSIIDLINPPLITAFTATASSPVLEKITKYIFGGLQVRQITGNPDRPNISYSAEGCINRDLAVRDLLIRNDRPAIVFCSSRPGTAKLAHYLRSELEEMGYGWYKEIRFYHAGLSRNEKKKTEEWLLYNTEAVLCSTCAFGMGVDKADIRTVIHRDCPPSAEAYLQESGRAGRDGKQSKAILLWGPDDENALVRAKNETDKKRLASVLNYARDNKNCRRHALLSLLNYDSGGEVPENFCCDVCYPKDNSYLSGNFDSKANGNLREESSTINFFKKNKRRFTQSQAASVLAAAKTIRWSETEASRAIGYLIKTKKLRRLNLFPWRNKITL
ncbi:MAG: RecQ family ATP-dependent DNA helicase [Treponema sp.]|nr:RecQ family ATP-dependent DNA helicase [Treponema sp.]